VTGRHPPADVRQAAFDYGPAVPGDSDAFEVILREALSAGVGRSGLVARSTSHLFGAREIVAFAVAWPEERFSP